MDPLACSHDAGQWLDGDLWRCDLCDRALSVEGDSTGDFVPSVDDPEAKL